MRAFKKAMSIDNLSWRNKGNRKRNNREKVTLHDEAFAQLSPTFITKVQLSVETYVQLRRFYSHQSETKC